MIKRKIIYKSFSLFLSFFLFANTRHSFQIGDRVFDRKGFKGTVKYIGPVATAKSIEDIYVGNLSKLSLSPFFLSFTNSHLFFSKCEQGVEWDDLTRGKHDGSVTDSDVRWQ